MQRLIPVAFAVLLMGAGTDRPRPLDAAREADWNALRSLVQAKADVNATDADGSSALHWAAYHDNLEACELLLRAGAEVNAVTDLGVTPLWTASLNGNGAIVRKLLQAGANPNRALLSGETPLMVAARGGKSEVVELLLAKGADADARGARGQTALMWAAAREHPDVVQALVAHGANVQARSDVWNEVMAVPPHGYPEYNRAIPHGGDTALLFAARVGDLASAKLLVAAGAKVNDADAWGVSATVLAAHSGYEEMVEFLLEHGADASSSAAGFTALHEAILRRDEKLVSALLAHGADPNAPLRAWTPTRRSSHDFHFEPALVGATPFWLAARFTEPEIMRQLLRHGADPLCVHRSEYVSREGFKKHVEVTTAVMAAMGMGGGGTAWVEPAHGSREALTLEAVKVAAAPGVDCNAANTDGRTALDAATALRYQSVVKFLLEQGAVAGRPVRQKSK